MTLAQVHLPAAFTVPAAAALAAAILWHWGHLAAREVPESRRRIRRAAAVMMLLALPAFAIGLSFADTSTSPAVYYLVWLLSMFMLGLVVVLAGFDLANTLRLERKDRHEQARKAAQELAEALRGEKRLRERFPRRKSLPEP